MTYILHYLQFYLTKTFGNSISEKHIEKESLGLKAYHIGFKEMLK